jgi:uncharacterized protein
MNQRLSTSFFGLFCLICLIFASTSNAGNAVTNSSSSIKKTAESTFTEGIQCLKRSDVACAKIALLRIPAQDIYAKILDGAIAAAENDLDKTFRLLLPIQVSGATEDSTVLPSAIASLHASLALAYDQQADTLRSLEQRILAERYWLAADEVDANQIKQNQKNIWSSLATVDRSRLVEMRGESFNTSTQGWLDLALSAQTSSDMRATIADWRKVYPDHTAYTDLILELTPQSSNPQLTTASTSEKKVALLLPFGSAAFYTAADAIERGFMAAKEAAKDDIEVVIYPTSGDKDLITAVYQKAINEGANFVVGPLARDEITALTTGKLAVPTLALNQAESNLTLNNLYSLGLSIDTEAAQIAKMARDFGMQTAVIVASDNGAAPRMAKAFEDAWVAEGGQLIFQANINEETSPEELQTQLQSHPADMILLATHPELGRAVRAYLDITTPTYGFSHIYSGVNYEPEDAALLAVRFIDLPWILTTEDSSFDIYKEAASNLPEGMMQRWFALGVDAYQVLSVIAAQSGQKTSIRGLTGRIQVGVGGNIERTLAVGRFTGDGVVLEQAP